MPNECDIKPCSIKHFFHFICLLLLCLAVTPPLQAEEVELDWAGLNPAPEHYRLFQRKAGESYTYSDPICSTAKTLCAVKNLAPETTYHFVVRAYKGSAYSQDSNEVTHTTAAPNTTTNNTDPPSPPPPTNQADISQPNANNTISQNMTVIIDNGDQGTTPKGSWSFSGGKNPYGGSSLYCRNVGDNYTYKSTLTGDIDVYLWWTQYGSRGTAVPIEIFDGANRLETVYVNQKQNGGQWNHLGRYNFYDSARVRVFAITSSYSTCADAAKFFVHSSMVNETGPVSPPPTQVMTSAIIDNGDSGCTATGNWRRSGGADPYGGNSLFCKGHCEYTYSAAMTGSVKISLWWTQYKSRCDSIPVDIYDGDQFMETVEVNQLQNGGRWNFLYESPAPFNQSVKVVIDSQYTNCSTSADAVRIELLK